jgi:hypothetical protein
VRRAKPRRRRASKDRRQLDLEMVVAFDAALGEMAVGTGLAPAALLKRLTDSDVAANVLARNVGRQLPYEADLAQLRENVLALAAAKQRQLEAR